MKNIQFRLILLFTANIFIATLGLANVTVHSLFSDHMVLQQNVAVPVWGTATDNENITVNFSGQTLSTKAINGKWMVKLKPLHAGGPFIMTVKGENTIMVNDVLVGEVWLCSGQSNMERQLGPRPPQKPIVDWEKEMEAANYPQIREYYVPLKFSAIPLVDIGNKWQVCSPATAKEFTAVGYFFARDLFANLKIPVGIIFSAYGGTDAESWISMAALESNPTLIKLVQDYDKSVASFPERLEKYKQQETELWKKFSVDSAEAKASNKTLPKKPSAPSDPTKGRLPGGLFNGMITPILPYAIKGVCWYQGENNNERWKQYPTVLSTLIADWRNDFQLGDFPFLIVQIAPFKTMLPEIRDAQLTVSKTVKNTALIVTTDCGDSNDIHPAHKQPVGERLSLAARALAYKQNIEYNGPIYQKMKIKNNKVVLSFGNVAKGLIAKDGPLIGFTIAGADSVFVPAKAEIKGKEIIVYSEAVPTPIAVRFGWENVPHTNLYNSAALPASPFKTDF